MEQSKLIINNIENSSNDDMINNEDENISSDETIKINEYNLDIHSNDLFSDSSDNSDLEDRFILHTKKGNTLKKICKKLFYLRKQHVSVAMTLVILFNIIVYFLGFLSIFYAYNVKFEVWSLIGILFTVLFGLICNIILCINIK